MINQEPGANQNEKPTAGYRGGLVYRQEYGYKLITMTVSLYTNEQSKVVSHAYDLDITEEAEHIPSGPPLAAVDLYHFPVTDDTVITLTITSQEQKQQARYTIHSTGIEEDSPFLWLDIVRSPESISDQSFQPYHDLEIYFEA